MPRQTRYIFREARKRKKLTISELSSKMKISPLNIKNWESVGSKITINNLKILSKSLDISPNELIFNEDDKKIINVSNLTPIQINQLLELYYTLRMDDD